MSAQFDPLLGQMRDGAVTLAEQTAGFNKGTAAEKAAFQASVSGVGAYLKIPNVLSPPQQQMSAPPTVSVSTVGSQISGGVRLSIWGNGDTSHPYGIASALSFTSPSGGAQYYRPVTMSADGATRQNQSYKYSSIFDGTQIEFEIQSAGGTLWIKIDDKYINAAGIVMPADAAWRWVTITFPVRTSCRLEYVSYGLSPSTVITDPVAGLTPAPIRGSSCIMVGDSFNGTQFSYPRIIGDMLLWDDVRNSGVPGTGLLANNLGASQTFVQRFPADVLAYKPTICWVVGSINDDGSTPAAVSAALLGLYNSYIATVPGGVFIWSPNADGGCAKWSTNKNKIRSACKQVLSGLKNAYVVDILEQTLYTQSAVPAGILYGSVTVGVNNFRVVGTQAHGGYPGPGSTIKIGDEYMMVKSGAFAGNDAGLGKYYYRIYIDGVTQQAHADGDAWQVVGGAYITGSGDGATPSGYGNSDVYVSTDHKHPTQLGQIALAAALANGLKSFF